MAPLEGTYGYDAQDDGVWVLDVAVQHLALGIACKTDIRFLILMNLWSQQVFMQ